MARIRSIKPEFWNDKKIAYLPQATALFFISLWNFADDLLLSTKMIKLHGLLDRVQNEMAMRTLLDKSLFDFKMQYRKELREMFDEEVSDKIAAELQKHITKALETK